jgi:uncharacterized protein (DUF58 family)
MPSRGSRRSEMTGERASGSPRALTAAKLGIALVATGLGFGLTAALVCGLGLLGLVVGMVSWVELSVRGGRLERERGPTRMEESESYPLRLSLGGTLLPPPGGELTDPLLDFPIPVGPRWGRWFSRDVRLDGPGRRELVPARLTVQDPLGLWPRELHSDRSDELVVLPRVEAVDWGEAGSGAGGRPGGDGAGGDAGSARRGLANLEVDGLRPYRDGSPASRIHWPAVARTGEMFERRLVTGGDPRPLVVLDPRGGTERAEWEKAMRAAASLCVWLGRAGGCDLLLPGERRPLGIDPALHGWPAAHTRIALADPAASVGIPSGLRGAVVIWVTAARELPASVRLRHPGSVLVTPHGSRRAAILRVAGCFGYLAVAAERRAPSRRAAA